MMGPAYRPGNRATTREQVEFYLALFVLVGIIAAGHAVRRVARRLGIRRYG